MFQPNIQPIYPHISADFKPCIRNCWAVDLLHVLNYGSVRYQNSVIALAPHSCSRISICLLGIHQLILHLWGTQYQVHVSNKKAAYRWSGLTRPPIVFICFYTNLYLRMICMCYTQPYISYQICNLNPQRCCVICWFSEWRTGSVWRQYAIRLPAPLKAWFDIYICKQWFFQLSIMWNSSSNYSSPFRSAILWYLEGL